MSVAYLFKVTETADSCCTNQIKKMHIFKLTFLHKVTNNVSVIMKKQYLIN